MIPGHVLLQDAIARHRGGDLAGAERCYREVLSREPGYADAMHMLGVLRFQRGDSAGGVELVRNAIGLDSNRPSYHIDLGEMLKAQGQCQEAADAYRCAIELAPERAAAHNGLGITLQMLGNFSGAIASFETTLRLAPEFSAAALNLCDVLRKSGQLQEAAGVLERAVAANPHCYETRVNLGSCLLNLGQYARAIECLRQAVERWPSRPEAHIGLGNSLHAASRHDDALICYKRALSVDANAVEAHIGIGAICVEKGALDQAGAAYREVLRVCPDHVDSRVNLAFVEARRGNADEVERICRETLAFGKASAPALSESDADHLGVDVESDLNIALGEVHDSQGNHAQGFRHFAHANRLYHAKIAHDPASRDEFVSRTLSIFDAKLLKRLQTAGDPDKRPIFIVGMPHSGKTLLEQILSSHPLVHGAGELEYFQKIMASAGGDMPFLEWVRTLSIGTGDRIARDYLTLLTHDSSRARRITNTTPYNFLCLGLIGALFPNAMIVNCERDPRDTGLSIYFHRPFDQEFEVGYCSPYDLGLTRGFDLYEIGRYYAQYRRLMAHWKLLMPGRIVTVRYEDLIANQMSESRRLLNDCGLEWDERCLDFYKHHRPIHITSNWKVRQPIHSRFVGRWKHYSKWIGPLEKGLKDFGTGKEPTA